ncbi:hypothetical protein ABT354_06715 [Streptomyces sp. NPDC000594]|uniref:hypothetical protein n=1 Tax=Streptomyces sp. NPDC000594 TaxID=3154261 RepID=UPI003323AE5C
MRTDPTAAPGPAGASAPPGGRIPAVTPELAECAVRAALRGAYGDGLLPPEAPAAVAHPNGFVKLPLARVAQDARRLFLHIWQDGAEDAHIHNHRWDFASTLLSGGLANTLVETAPTEPERPTAYRAVHHRPHGDGFRLDATDAPWVRVTGSRTTTLTAGDRYRMPARTLHRAAAPHGTITLVARGTPLHRTSRVLIRGEAPDEPLRWRHVGPAERGALLRRALGCLA